MNKKNFTPNYAPHRAYKPAAIPLTAWMSRPGFAGTFPLFYNLLAMLLVKLKSKF